MLANLLLSRFATLGAINGRSMEENKFFRYIWRIKGLILLVAGKGDGGIKKEQLHELVKI
jgi:hypothetical protein